MILSAPRIQPCVPRVSIFLLPEIQHQMSSARRVVAAVLINILLVNALRFLQPNVESVLLQPMENTLILHAMQLLMRLFLFARLVVQMNTSQLSAQQRHQQSAHNVQLACPTSF